MINRCIKGEGENRQFCDNRDMLVFCMLFVGIVFIDLIEVNVFLKV